MKRARVDGRRWEGRNALTGVPVGARFVNPAVSVGILVKDVSAGGSSCSVRVPPLRALVIRNCYPAFTRWANGCRPSGPD